MGVRGWLPSVAAASRIRSSCSARVTLRSAIIASTTRPRRALSSYCTMARRVMADQRRWSASVKASSASLPVCKTEVEKRAVPLFLSNAKTCTEECKRVRSDQQVRPSGSADDGGEGKLASVDGLPCGAAVVRLSAAVSTLLWVLSLLCIRPSRETLSSVGETVSVHGKGVSITVYKKTVSLRGH